MDNMTEDTSTAIHWNCYYKITDSDGDFDTYWYGSYNNGYGLYTPGSVMTLYYDGFHNYPGFQLVFYLADPGEADLYTQSTATIGESES